MNYFPPSNAKAEWLCGDKRRSYYKNWWMEVVEIRTGFSGMVWQFVAVGHYGGSKCVSKKKSRFKTEEAAVAWCENKVEMLEIDKSLIPQYAGSGI